MPTRKVVLWAAAVLSFLACAYSLLGLFMVASFSVSPNYSSERAELNANFWGTSLIVSFVLWGILFVLAGGPSSLAERSAATRSRNP